MKANQQFKLFAGKYILVTVFFLVTATTNAQVFSWGFKGGLNYGTPYGKPPEGASGDLGVGPNLGVFVRYNVNEDWNLQVEFSYSYKVAKFRTPISGDTVWMQEILVNGVPTNVPITVKYKGMATGSFDKRPHLCRLNLA